MMGEQAEEGDDVPNRAIEDRLLEVMEQMGQNCEAVLSVLIELDSTERSENTTVLWDEILTVAAETKGAMGHLQQLIAERKRRLNAQP
jgi:hypothetical protein